MPDLPYQQFSELVTGEVTQVKSFKKFKCLGIE